MLLSLEEKRRKVFGPRLEQRKEEEKIKAREVFLGIRRLLSPEEQFRVCLEDAGLSCTGPSDVVGRTYCVDVGTRGTKASFYWRKIFWGTIKGVLIDDGAILTLLLSHDLLLLHNQKIKFDCFEKDKKWQSKSWLTEDDSSLAAEKFLTGLHLSFVGR
ncbi:MAG: hypothetical protein G01um101456_700 [Parcubacteria group bacterium Gr01-1014_56]|nr:MAG: hypothetical protein G01um101456_700 [Parcubacteria group bacterium Gr01-1014_56]